MATPTVSWDESNPAGSQSAALGDNRIRELKSQLREVIAVDHKMDSSGQGNDWGKHNKITLIEQADVGSGTDGYGAIGLQTVDDTCELVFTDENNNDIQLTEDGNMGSTSTTINALDINASGDIAVSGTIYISGTSPLILDEDDFASDSATQVPSQQSVKSYVDNSVVSLGDWDSSTYSINTIYQASTDGFVCATINGGTTAGLTGITDANSEPTTVRLRTYAEEVEGTVYQCLTMPVKSGDYWKITGQNESDSDIQWIPLS